jgi:hypothetical protein
MKSAMCVATLALLVGCGAESDRGGVQTETRAGALNPGGFGTWSFIPGASSFTRRPALDTVYSSASERQWSVCGTTSSSILCNYRHIGGGHDYGWNGWATLTPPSGFTFGASAPAMADWTDNLGNYWSAIAARVNGISCPNCIYIQVGQHGSSSTWYKVPHSGVIDPYANVDDFALVASGGYLYIFGVGGGGPYSAYYAQNYVQTGYNNTQWSWSSIPGGGVFNKPVLAAPLAAGGAIVVGIGTDKAAYGQAIFDGSWDGYWWYAGVGSFKDAVSGTSFDRYGSDLEVFGLGSDGYEWEGNLYDYNSFDGWYAISNQNSFLSSPVAYLPPGTSHIDLAALRNTHEIGINEFNGGPNP